MKILIVDDEEIGLLTLQKTVEHLGYAPTTAHSGEEALTAFQQEPFNVIISDWHMPGIDGIELCRQLRKISTSHYTYFILVSASRLQTPVFADATLQGIDDFLIMPLDPSDLANRLHVAERIISFTTEIKRLKQMFPICMYCHKVRNDSNYWQEVERYIHDTTGSNFSHGICPDCFRQHVESELNT
jgi:CheY-like chemotaxis protein